MRPVAGCGTNCFNAGHLMPSPLGHALGGAAAAWLAGGRLRRGPYAEAAVFGAIAMLPDLDLLVGAHSTYTHSIGAVLLATGLALSVTRGRSPWVAMGVAAAWSSHILLDWLGSDTSPPIGIMALWPFTDGFYQSSLCIFDAISRRYWLPQEFIWGNLRAVSKEILMLGPVAWVAMRLACRRRSR
jgi:LexA-binding, inner membrane-associated putative hydrolase